MSGLALLGMLVAALAATTGAPAGEIEPAETFELSETPAGPDEADDRRDPGEWEDYDDLPLLEDAGEENVAEDWDDSDEESEAEDQPVEGEDEREEADPGEDSAANRLSEVGRVTFIFTKCGETRLRIRQVGTDGQRAVEVTVITDANTLQGYGFTLFAMPVEVLWVGPGGLPATVLGNRTAADSTTVPGQWFPFRRWDWTFGNIPAGPGTVYARGRFVKRYNRGLCLPSRGQLLVSTTLT